MRMSKFVFVFCMFVLLGSLVQACVSYPLVETKNGCSIQFDKNEYRNSTSVMKKLNEMKSDCGLSDTDIFTLNFFVINGYSVKQQNKNEYKTFLGNAEKSNAERPSSCFAYEAVFNKNGWTGYIESGKEYEDEECVEDKCVGAITNLLWNDLKADDKIPDVNVSDDGNTPEENKSSGFNYLYVVIPVFVIIALFVIFKLMVSGDKEEESKSETSKPLEENKEDEKEESREEEIKEKEEIKPVEKRHVDQRRQESTEKSDDWEESKESDEEDDKGEEENSEEDDEEKSDEEDEEDEDGLV